MDQNTFSTIVRGFDVLVEAGEEDDMYHVSVTEGTGTPWEVDIAIDLDSLEGENDDLDGSNELLTYASEAAVDLFEGQRGTLGEGAGALEVQAMKKKRAYEQSMYWEDWFYKLKGTPFEAEATSLLGQLFSLDMEEIPNNEVLDSLYDEEKKICYDLNMLNLERMEAAPAGEVVIIIQGQNKVSAWGFDCIQDYLDSFTEDPLETKAISKAKELVNVREKIDQYNGSQGDNGIWQQRRELENRMEQLLFTCLEQKAMPAESLTGIESAPVMANDLAELMEGVDLNEPLSNDNEVIPKLNPLAASFADVMEEKEESGNYEKPTPGDDEVRSPGSDAVAQSDSKEKTAQVVFEDPKTEEIYELIMADNQLFNQVLEMSQGNDLITFGNDLVGLVEERIASQVWPTDVMIGEVDWYGLAESFIAMGGTPMVASIHEAFSEVEPVEERIDELGNIRNDLDPGLLEPQQFAFNQNERVRFKRELERPFGWGGTIKYPKGTLGYAESQYDKQGDYYFIRLDNNHLVKVRWDDLEAASKE